MPKQVNAATLTLKINNIIESSRAGLLSDTEAGALLLKLFKKEQEYILDEYEDPMIKELMRRARIGIFAFLSKV